MNLRLSSALMHQYGMQSLLTKQSEIGKIQQQLTTGARISQGKDDPAAMAAAQRLDHALAQIEQQNRNSDRVKSRLEVQDTALGDASDILTRARELAIQANVSTLSDTDRAAIAIEIRSLRESMISIANRDDGNGRMLFAGTRDGVVPFTDFQGLISYDGDDGHIRMDIGLDLAVKDTNPGSEVFLRIPTGNGLIASQAGLSNVGTGVLSSINVLDSATWANQTLQLQFSSPTDFEVLDGDGNALTPPVLVTGWSPGQQISVEGLKFTLTGTPEAGDSFTVAPAPNQDIFTTLKDLAEALEMPMATPAQQATVRNALTGAVASLATAQEHMLSLRASTGSRLNAIEMAEDARSADSVSLKTNLSALRDTNYTEVITQLSLQLTSLEAAQATMLRLQGMSLFERM